MVLGGFECVWLGVHGRAAYVWLLVAGTFRSRVRAVLALCPVPPSGIAVRPEAAGLFRSRARDRTQQGKILDMACRALAPEARALALADAETVDPALLADAFHAWTRGVFEALLGDIPAPVRLLATDDPFLRFDLPPPEVRSRTRAPLTPRA